VGDFLTNGAWLTSRFKISEGGGLERDASKEGNDAQGRHRRLHWPKALPSFRPNPTTTPKTQPWHLPNNTLSPQLEEVIIGITCGNTTS
jgi:hypothetical protein